jgi:hypothetical protein
MPVKAASALSISGMLKKPRMRPAFFLAALLFVSAQSYAQQPWPGAGSNADSGSGSASNQGAGQSTGQNGQGSYTQNREPSSSLRPVLPVPPPPPPPPLNPVFPDQGQQQNPARQGSEAGQNSASQPNPVQWPGAPLPPAVSGAAVSGNAVGGNQQPSVTESLLLTATEVYPGGNRNLSATDTVSHIFYTAYSDQSCSFAVVFKSDPPYTYYFRNPRSLVQMGPDVLRITYDAIIQAGTQMVMGFFFSEVYYTKSRPSSLTVVNSSSGAAVVMMNLRETQP